MKILFVCHRWPFPPQRGGKIRPFNIVKHLSRVHRVTVASLARSQAEAQDGAGLARYARCEMAVVSRPLQAARMWARLVSRQPSSMGYFYSRRLAARITQLLARERFDLIFVHCSSVAPYVSAVRSIPKLLDFGDMDSQKWLDYARHQPFPWSVGYRLEGVKLQRTECELAAQFDLCTATTPAEWQTLQSYRAASDADWFPNGVDAEYFAPDASEPESGAICFVGRMDYYPNQESMRRFCAEVLPRIHARVPGATLTIVGANPPRWVRRLGRLAGVTVTGSVPDVRPYLRRAMVMVAPLRIARGTQNKILEAMAAGVPVVVSSIAAAGVDAEPERHFLVADAPADQADAVIRVLTDAGERARLADAARARMLSHHSWPSSMARLDGLIDRCLTSRHPIAYAR